MESFSPGAGRRPVIAHVSAQETSGGALDGRRSGTAGGREMSTAFRIRAARPTDFDAVERLLIAAGLPTADVDQQFDDRFAVAESESGDVIGAEGIETHGVYGLLRSAVVAELWRGTGVGDALTKNRLAWATARGLAQVYLLTTTAAEYFRRRGFETIRRSDVPNELLAASEFVSVCPSTATVMRLAGTSDTSPSKTDGTPDGPGGSACRR